jgi:hypothetical protein
MEQPKGPLWLTVAVLVLGIVGIVLLELSEYGILETLAYRLKQKLSKRV